MTDDRPLAGRIALGLILTTTWHTPWVATSRTRASRS